jgi:hypothetical protein
MRRIWLVLCVGGLVWTLPGCHPAGKKLVPVTGKVILDGQPWTIGDVGFFPDADKGNTNQQASVGVIAADGVYQLLTAGKRGAPPGWYKVVVWATNDPAAAGNPWGTDGKPRPINWLIDAKYTNKDTTTLTVEVVENPLPGQYDLIVTR